ncbi:MAG: SH3 domain-containing protein, partial [Chloroflexi bacterium]|nr:SH3 domain-containing protein [Chloroflexota bacterium]
EPVLGSVASLQDVNVRSGPGIDFPAIDALQPGTLIEVLDQNAEGSWLNIRMTDEEEGWISATLVRLQDTSTPIPSGTPTPNLTALALGTPLPTALFGGGTITPTPPSSIVTPTAIREIALATAAPNAAADDTAPALPDLASIGLTATALAGGLPPTPDRPVGGPTGGPRIDGSPTRPPTANPNASAQQGVDVLAYCDDRSYGSPPPSDLGAGSTIDVFWSWFATTRAFINDHLDAVSYTVTVNGEPLNWRQFQTNIRQPDGGDYFVYWFVPYGPLAPGEYRIEYSVSWSRAINDGYAQFGPGTGIPSQSGSCTFVVR